MEKFLIVFGRGKGWRIERLRGIKNKEGDEKGESKVLMGF